MSTFKSRNSGFALPLVLIILSLLTALSFGLTRTVSANTQILQERKTAWEQELAVRDTIEQSVLMLLTGSYDSVSVHHEMGRLPLNNSPIALNNMEVRVQSWSGLYSLSLFGAGNVDAVLRHFMEAQKAAEIAAELADWVDEDERRRFRGAEGADYRSKRLPQRPRNAPLRSIDELIEIPSVTTESLNVLEPGVGLRDIFLAGGASNFDLGTAPDFLIGPALGLSGRVAENVVEARRSGDWSQVRMFVDEHHWAFNDHPIFYKGMNYRMLVTNQSGAVSRVQLELTPFNQERIYEVIDWQVPEYAYE